MSNFEFNKLFAAFLIAGIIAYLSAFIADHVIHPHELEEDAVFVEGAPVETGGAAAPKGPDPILHLIATADIAKGEKLSKACAACHSFDKGGAAKVGPNLYGIVGNTKAHSPDFAYSDAMQAKEGDWNYLSLNKFLYKPKDYIDGTKMLYIGMKKPEDRAAIIAWLRTLADSQYPLPTQGQIDAELAELAPPPAEGEDGSEGVGEDETSPDGEPVQAGAEDGVSSMENSPQEPLLVPDTSDTGDNASNPEDEAAE